jgi:hypothetical protein
LKCSRRAALAAWLKAQIPKSKFQEGRVAVAEVMEGWRVFWDIGLNFRGGGEKCRAGTAKMPRSGRKSGI